MALHTVYVPLHVASQTTKRFFIFNHPSPQNFCSREVYGDPPSLQNLQIFFTLIFNTS